MAAPLPESLAKGLQDIAALPQPVFDRFLEFLRAIPVEIKQYRIFNADQFKALDLPDKGESINEAAFSLIISRVGRRISIDEFVNGLIEAISSSADMDEARLETLKRRATDILRIDTLDLVARAHNVLLEHSQTFSTARIVSDVRPVFGEDVLAEPLGAVLVHMLSVAHRSAGRRENFVVALDEKDLDHLIQILERAKNKTKTLRTLLENTKLPFIKVV